MAISASELQRLEQEFATGRNPLAYIPLVQALRRTRQFARALEVCMRGLQTDASSIAGRTLFARVLGDVGRYEDSLREADRALAVDPYAVGPLVEKARSLIRLHREAEADVIVSALTARNPLDPQVQLLNSELLRLRQVSERSGFIRMPKAARPMRSGTEELLARLLAALQGVAPVQGGAVVPLDAGAPAVHGEVGAAEAALTFANEVSLAALELDSGNLSAGLLETERRILLVALRKRLVISLSVDAQVPVGKVLHRFQQFLAEAFPEAGEATGEDTKPPVERTT